MPYYAKGKFFLQNISVLPSRGNLPNREIRIFFVIFASLTASFSCWMSTNSLSDFCNNVLFKLEKHHFFSIIGLRDISKFLFLSSEECWGDVIHNFMSSQSSCFLLWPLLTLFRGTKPISYLCYECTLNTLLIKPSSFYCYHLPIFQAFQCVQAKFYKLTEK